MILFTRIYCFVLLIRLERFQKIDFWIFKKFGRMDQHFSFKSLYYHFSQIHGHGWCQYKNIGMVTFRRSYSDWWRRYFRMNFLLFIGLDLGYMIVLDQSSINGLLLQLHIVLGILMNILMISQPPTSELLLDFIIRNCQISKSHFLNGTP